MNSQMPMWVRRRVGSGGNGGKSRSIHLPQEYAESYSIARGQSVELGLADGILVVLFDPRRRATAERALVSAGGGRAR